MSKHIPGFFLKDLLFSSHKTSVYTAIRESDQQQVRLKISHKEPAFLNHEYEIVRELNENEIKGVVKFLDVIKLPDVYCTVMDDDDFVCLSRGIPLNLKTFLTIAINLAQTLGEIHNHHVIHLDIEPQNILYHPKTLDIKFIDFTNSIRTTVDNPQVSPTKRFKLDYVSPEQTGRVNRMVDHRADLYSLGITFFHLLSGRTPFEGMDDVEILHAHIARPCPDITKIVKDLPPLIGGVISKLVAKAPKHRYQSSFVLKEDLLAISTILNSPEAHDRSFELGVNDIMSLLRTSDKLYGREKQVEQAKTMIQDLKQIPTHTGLLLVSGNAGVGKTALVEQKIKHLVQAWGGHMITACCDASKKEIPYRVFSEAISSLLRVFVKDELKAAKMREELRVVITPPVAHVLSESIEEVELFVSSSQLCASSATIPQPSPTVSVQSQTQPNPLSASGSSASLNSLLLASGMISLVRSILSVSSQPLAIFLDDAHLVDPSTLKLIQQLLLSETTLPNLLLILAYRTIASEDAENDHLFRFMQNFVGTVEPEESVTPKSLKMLGKGGSRSRISRPSSRLMARRLEVEPLDRRHLQDLIKDTTRHPSEEMTSLFARELHQRTKGYPFYARQFLATLQREGLLTLDVRLGYWSWDIERVRELPHSDNIVEFLISVLKTVREVTRNALSIAACIGPRFHLDILSRLTEFAERDLKLILQVAVDEGLIRTSRDDAGDYGFVHQFVQQACYSFASPHELDETHLALARILKNVLSSLDTAPAEGDSTLPKWVSCVSADSLVFDVIGHYNKVHSRLKDIEERRDVARLNLRAGRQAMVSCNYRSAVEILHQGIAVLGPSPWKPTGSVSTPRRSEDDRRLNFSLFLSCAESEHFIGEIETAKGRFQELMEHAASPLERVAIYETQVQCLLSSGRSSDLRAAWELGLSALGLLGFQLDQDEPSLTSWLLTLVSVSENINGSLPDVLCRTPLSAPSLDGEGEVEANAHEKLSQWHTVYLLYLLVPVSFVLDRHKYSLLVLNFARWALVKSSLWCGLSTLGLVAGSHLVSGRSEFAGSSLLGEMAVSVADHAPIVAVPSLGSLVRVFHGCCGAFLTPSHSLVEFREYAKTALEAALLEGSGGSASAIAAGTSFSLSHSYVAPPPTSSVLDASTCLPWLRIVCGSSSEECVRLASNHPVLLPILCHHLAIIDFLTCPSIEELGQHLTAALSSPGEETPVALYLSSCVEFFRKGQTAPPQTVLDGDLPEDQQHPSLDGHWRDLRRPLRMFFLCLFGNDSLELIREVLLQENSSTINGFLLQIFEAVFESVLAATLLVSNSSSVVILPQEKIDLIDRISRNDLLLQKLVHENPVNEVWASMSFMVSAQKARAEGNTLEGLRLLEQSVSSKEIQRFPGLYGLFLEITGREFARCRLNTSAGVYLGQSHATYCAWGALSKADEVVKQWPHLSTLSFLWSVGDGLTEADRTGKRSGSRLGLGSRSTGSESELRSGSPLGSTTPVSSSVSLPLSGLPTNGPANSIPSIPSSTQLVSPSSGQGQGQTPQMMSGRSRSSSSSILSGGPRSYSTLTSFDVVSVMKAVDVLCVEKNHERLLQKLMEVVLLNAGAQRGLLILSRLGSLSIEAESNTTGATSSSSVLQSEPLTSDLALLPLIQQVVQTKKFASCDNAFEEGDYVQDPYVKQTQLMSVLCLPVIHQEQLVGLLYLENNLTAGAFTKDRIQILKVIAAQAAMSIENVNLGVETQKLKDELGKVQEQYQSSINSLAEQVIVKLHSLKDKFEKKSHEYSDIEFVMRAIANNKLYDANLRLGDAETQRWLSAQIGDTNEEEDRSIPKSPHSKQLGSVASESLDFLNKPHVPSKISAVDSPERPAKWSRFVASLSRQHRPLPHIDDVPSNFPSQDSKLNIMIEQMERWDFDIFEFCRLCEGRSIYYLACALFTKQNLVKRFNINEEKLKNFMIAIEEGYKQNPYHNSIHAADVTQTVHYFLTTGGLSSLLSDADIIATYLASIIHDYRHPGVTNKYLIDTSDPLSYIYNDISVLENFHLAESFAFLLDEETNIFSNVAPEQRIEIRKSVITTVLSTDLANHVSILGQFKAKSSCGINRDLQDDRQLILKIIIKSADVSHSVKPWSMHQQWSMRIMEEFYLQGDRERELGLPITAFMDRRNPAVPKCQLGFMRFFVEPLYTSWFSLLNPQAQATLMQHMKDNLNHWKDELQKEEEQISSPPTNEHTRDSRT